MSNQCPAKKWCLFSRLPIDLIWKKICSTFSINVMKYVKNDLTGIRTCNLSIFPDIWRNLSYSDDALANTELYWNSIPKSFTKNWNLLYSASRLSWIPLEAYQDPFHFARFTNLITLPMPATVNEIESKRHTLWFLPGRPRKNSKFPICRSPHIKLALSSSLQDCH